MSDNEIKRCKNCIHFKICQSHTTKEECFPEVNGCPLFEKKLDIKFCRVIKVLEKEYAKAKKQEWIEKPLAYALYQVWRKFDREANKNMVKKNKFDNLLKELVGEGNGKEEK